MTQLKPLTAARLERLILGLGFVKIRQKGSHAFYRHEDGRTTTIPHHSQRFASPFTSDDFAGNSFEY
jgi:predicted RNA binding protein YcfA (HicA-like mRNA interferase family)